MKSRKPSAASRTALTAFAGGASLSEERLAASCDPFHRRSGEATGTEGAIGFPAWERCTGWPTRRRESGAGAFAGRNRIEERVSGTSDLSALSTDSPSIRDTRKRISPGMRLRAWRFFKELSTVQSLRISLEGVARR